MVGHIELLFGDAGFVVYWHWREDGHPSAMKMGREAMVKIQATVSSRFVARGGPHEPSMGCWMAAS